jgi:hypothetical protein
VLPAPFVAQSLLVPLLACLPACGVAWWLDRWLNPETWLETIGAAIVTGLVALLGLLLFATTRWERARYYSTVRHLAGVS